MKCKKILPVEKIEGLNDRELCEYAKLLGIDLTPYADELEEQKFFLKEKNLLVVKILKIHAHTFKEEEITRAERAAKIAIIGAVAAIVGAIVSIVALFLSRNG